jgi:hypothetical protein
MRLLVVFLITLVICQAISIGLGLLVERHVSPYSGLVTFIAAYFLMFVVAWKVSVRITEPRARAGGEFHAGR